VLTVADLRACSVSRSLWRERHLKTALKRLGFVQADPIRAPARAQDLILRPRVAGYLAGDLEQKYAKLEVEEDFFVNYGFVHRSQQPFFHPRIRDSLKIERDSPGLSDRVLEFVRANGATHPRELEQHFGKLSVGNYWGGTSQATTRVLDALHYRGWLRVARRDKGIKVYEAAKHLEPFMRTPLPESEMVRGVLELIISVYAPLSATSLGYLCTLSGYGSPHLRTEIRKAAKNLETVVVDGVKYVLPPNEPLGASGNDTPQDTVTLLAPFDPMVWDRRRFAHLHGWEYRFEAYTKPEKRLLGYYALPMLYGEHVVGWANLAVKNGELATSIGYVKKPRGTKFQKALAAELEAMRSFLRLEI
jgi:uncharacterized protein